MTSKNDKLEKSKNYWLNEPNKFTDLYKTKKILHLPSKIFLKKRMEIIQKYLKEDNNATAVDVGCGSGEFANILKKYYGNVIGIDISDKMINLARKNSEKNITFQINECTNISLKDNSVDYIFALGLLDYVENLQNVFFEFTSCVIFYTSIQQGTSAFTGAWEPCSRLPHVPNGCVRCWECRDTFRHLIKSFSATCINRNR